MPISKTNIAVTYVAKETINGIELPLSKSVVNRLIILHAGYGQKLALPENLLNEDILAMQSAVSSLHANQEINAEEAGTVLRFILALASNTPHFSQSIVGTEKLMSRPIKPLIEILNGIGANIKMEGGKIDVEGKALVGGTLSLEPQQSSQFISALLLVASLYKEGLSIEISKAQTSMSYIKLTTDVLERAGIYIEPKGNHLQIPFQPNAILSSIDIERDWSAATFFICLSLINDGNSIYIEDIALDSNQSETIWCKQWIEKGIIVVTPKDNGLVFKRGTGALPQIIDFDNYPDAALNVITALVLLKHSFKATGLVSLNLKESKRLDLIQKIIEDLGAKVQHISNNEISIDASGIDGAKTNQFNSHNDHRIAMALSLISVKTPINIENPACVNKSFPYFWDEIEKLGFQTS